MILKNERFDPSVVCLVQKKTKLMSKITPALLWACLTVAGSGNLYEEHHWFFWSIRPYLLRLWCLRCWRSIDFPARQPSQGIRPNLLKLGLGIGLEWPGARFRKEVKWKLWVCKPWNEGKLWVFHVKMGGLSNPGKQGKSCPFLKER